jgi:Ser/Thr protein kinase RdoA (MazF antagonist)
MPWELVGFMPGAAVEWPTDGQAAAGMELLATLHVTACRLAGGWPRPAVSPGHRRRIEQARRLLDDPWPSRRGRLSGNGADNGPGGDRHRAEIVARLDAAIARFAAADGRLALRAVAACCAEPLPLQPVLRDVSGEHVLYDTHARGPAAAQAPTAIVDYHAAGIDTPATDIARLLGSWRRPVDRGRLSLTDAWPEAIAAYERVRPLDDRERRLVPFLHATAVVLGLDNWLRWTLDERRHFADPARVVARIDRLLAELEDAIAQTIDAAANLD